MEIDKIYFNKLPKKLLTEEQALDLARKKKTTFESFIIALLNEYDCRKKIYEAWLIRKQKNKPVTKLAEDYGASKLSKTEVRDRVNKYIGGAYKLEREKAELSNIIQSIVSAKLSTSLYEAVYNASILSDTAKPVIDNLYNDYINYRNQLITANLRLVPKFAAAFSKLGIPMLDLIQDGNSGLIRAVEKYDPDTGIKISGYASWWIKQSIRRAIKNNKRTIWLPHHIHDAISKIKNFKSEFRNKFKREPTIDEIELGTKFTRKKIEAAFNSTVLPISLETNVNSSNSRDKLKDVIEDEKTSKDSERLIEAELLRKIIDKNLDSRQKEIIYARFGLSGPEETLSNLSKRMKLTKERIRQLENEALKILKNYL